LVFFYFIKSSAGIEMLGGYGISLKDGITKNYELPPHSAIRIRANYHFIDAWQGGKIIK